MRAIKFISVLLIASSVAACSADSGPKEVGGTAGGAFTGAFIGNLIGRSAGNRVAGTLIGAAVGGFLGNRIGAALDDEDKRRAYAAQMQALETGPSGAPVAWRNPRVRALWQRRARSCRANRRRLLPAIHAYGLHRRPAAGRTRHRLPQSGRHLDGRELIRPPGFSALNS